MGDMVVDCTPRTYTVAEYHRMFETGVIGVEERVELLDGIVVEMPPIGPPHWTRHTRIFSYLISKIEGRGQVHGQISLPLGIRSEPEPDLAILVDLNFEQLQRTPDPAEILALIEISQSSLQKDTRTKRRLYAKFEIADYLVVDIDGDVLLHFSAPTGGDYPEPRRLVHGDTFRLAAFPDVELAADPFLRAV